MRRSINERNISGAERWIRLRGSSDDPESFDRAIWNGMAWELTATTDEGRTITLLIPDYMVAETLPADAKPQTLYKPLIAA